MKTLLIYSLSALILLISACSTDKIPGVYRIDIQQGNDVSQDMVNKLEAGMSKSQVAYIMGTPLLIDTFHPNRWDYIYSFHPGNGKREQRRVTLIFNSDETLKHVEGDTRTVARVDLPQNERKDSNVVVPLTEKKTSLFGSLMNSIGLGDDEPVIEDVDDNEKTLEVEKSASEDATEQ